MLPFLALFWGVFGGNTNNSITYFVSRFWYKLKLSRTL